MEGRYAIPSRRWQLFGVDESWFFPVPLLPVRCRVVNVFRCRYPNGWKRGRVVSHRQIEFRVVFAMASDIPVIWIQWPGPYRTHLHFNPSTSQRPVISRNKALVSRLEVSGTSHSRSAGLCSCGRFRWRATGPALGRPPGRPDPRVTKRGSQHWTQQRYKTREYNRARLSTCVAFVDVGKAARGGATNTSR